MSPGYVDVPRRLVQHPELNQVHALVSTLVKWREDWRAEWQIEHGEDPGPVSDTQVGEWMNKHRTTVQRASKRLAKVTHPGPKVAGHLRIQLSEVRKFGVRAAFAMAQLRGWPKRKDVEYVGQHFKVRACKLAKALGCCQKTASAALRGLRGTFVDLLWAKGYPTYARLLGERERAPLPEPPPPLSPPVPQLRLPQRPHTFRYTPKDVGEGYAHLFQVPT